MESGCVDTVSRHGHKHMVNRYPCNTLYIMIPFNLHKRKEVCTSMGAHVLSPTIGTHGTNQRTDIRIYEATRYVLHREWRHDIRIWKE